MTIDVGSVDQEQKTKELKEIEEFNASFDTRDDADKLADCVTYITDAIERIRGEWGDTEQFDAALAYVALNVTSELGKDDMEAVGKVGAAVEKVNLQ